MIQDSKSSVSRPIIHVVTTIMRGGAENQLLILVTEQVRLGFPVLVIFLKGTPELGPDLESVGAEVNYDFAEIKPIFQIKKLKDLLKLAKYKSAVIHAHLPRAQILSTLSVGKTQTLVCSRHDEDHFYPGANKFLSRSLFNLVDRRVDTWIAISNGVKEKMISFGELRKSSKIKVIHYGFPIDLELKNENKPEGNSIVIGCVARLVWQKDHVTLLKAFSTFIHTYPDAKLLIVGDGPLRSNLEKLCQDLSIEKNVTFVGKVNNVESYLQKMDIFVLSSSTEGFGLAVLEAMALNIPVIASDIPALSEVLAGTGLLFKTGDHLDLSNKMVELVDASKRAEIANGCYKRSKDYDPKQMCLQVIKAYDSVA